MFSARACNFYTISFVGRHARIYGPLGPMEGIAAFSVDGGGKTDVDLYSGKGRDNAMLFSTPLLASGPHTVRVRVTGLKNPAAGGYAVPAKRAEVATSLATASPSAIK